MDEGPRPKSSGNGRAQPAHVNNSSSFPDLAKVWRMEIKSEKNGKKALSFFFSKLQEVLE